MTAKTAMWRATSATSTEKAAEFGPIRDGWHASPEAALVAWNKEKKEAEPFVSPEPMPAPKRRGRPPKGN